MSIKQHWLRLMERIRAGDSATTQKVAIDTTTFNGAKIVVIPLSATSRAAAQTLLDRGVPIRLGVASNVLRRQFGRYSAEMCEMLTYDPEDVHSLVRLLKGADLCFFGPEDTVESMEDVIPNVFEALSRTKTLKGAVFSMSSSSFADELKISATNEDSQKFYESYVEIEQELLSLPYPVAIGRLGQPMEQFFFQAKEGIKEKKKLQYYNSSISLVSQLDAIECLIALLKVPQKKVFNLTTTDITKASEIPAVISAESGVEVSWAPVPSTDFQPLTKLSGVEFTKLVGYLDALGKVNRATDDVHAILGRAPTTLKAWIKSNKHWFV
jgi:hypothetical protein